MEKKFNVIPLICLWCLIFSFFFFHIQQKINFDLTLVSRNDNRNGYDIWSLVHAWLFILSLQCGQSSFANFYATSFFQTFLSHKYGYRPFPAKIEASEFESMLEIVEDDLDKDLLRKWFLKDLNMVSDNNFLMAWKLC